jgi:hypothetical protein
VNLRDNINDHIWKVCMNMIHTIFHVNTIFNGNKGELTCVDCILKCNSERHVCLSHLYAYSMAQLRAYCNRWWTVCLLAFNRKTDVLILIRIRIDITNCSRSLRSLPWRNQWSASITQHGTVYKEASEASGIKYLLYPLWGIDRYSLYKHRVQKFLSIFDG